MKGEEVSQTMFLICGEALYDLFVEDETPSGLRIDARIGGSPFNVAVGLARLGKSAALLTGSRPTRWATGSRPLSRRKGSRRGFWPA